MERKSSSGMEDGRGRAAGGGIPPASSSSASSATPTAASSLTGTAARPPRPMYPTDIPVLNELASLIGNLDLETPSKYRPPASSLGAAVAVSSSVDTSTYTSATVNNAPSRTPAPTSRFSIAPDTAQQARVEAALSDISGINLVSGADSSLFQMRGLLQAVTPSAAEATRRIIDDKDENTVVKYGAQCSLRTRQGRYLCGVAVASSSIPSAATAAPTDEVQASFHSSRNKQAKNNATYLLGADGQGVGELIDSLIFVNPENRDDKGPVKYGDVVSIKAPGCRERFLGTREGQRLGFWRNLIGQSEKWVVLKATQKGLEDVGARGYFVRSGEGVLVQSLSGDLLLSLVESPNGNSIRLVHRDRAWAANEMFQIQWFGSEPAPYWLSQRPYLSGKYMTMEDEERLPAEDEEEKAFPGVPRSRTRIDPPPGLRGFNEATQEMIFIRDILSCMSGVEGVYIRVTEPLVDPILAPMAPSTIARGGVAASNASGASAIAAPKLPFQDLTLVVDLDSADTSIASQVTGMLPMCEHSIKLRQFIQLHSRFEFGCISQSFAFAIKGLLREFEVLTAQLESLFAAKQLQSLQKLFYLIQPAASTLRLLNRLILRIGGKVGGQLLDELMACVQEQGDEKLRQMYTDILNKTAVPFLAMVSDWIFRGEIWDRSGEFMVQENTSFQRDALKDDFNARFWEGRYTLRRSQVPKIFRQHADKILAAGKYLNILRDCSIDVEEAHTLLPQRRQLFLGLDGSTDLMRIIEDAHLCSSRLLLRILMDRHGLIAHITSLRRFMLLEHGDFFVQFMDMAESELRQEAQVLTVSRVQALLQGAVQSSSLASDIHKDDFECILASHNLIQHLHLIQTAGAMGAAPSTFAIPANPLSSPPHGGDVAGSGPLVQGLKGVEALTFEYRVGWPVSIVLSRRAITKYQLLSRLLFFSKHVELRVLSCWRDHQQSKGLSGIRKALGESLCLRHRMLHFLQNFVYYMTVEVIAPRSHQLMEDLQAAQDIDEVLLVHERFLDTCLKECLLASQDLLRILTKLTTTCLLFADQMEKFMASTAEGVRRDPRETSGAAAKNAAVHRKVQADVIMQEISHEAYVRMIAKFSDAFDTQLAEFLDKLWNDSNRHHHQLSNLCIRLDYNGFYSDRFASEVPN